MSTSTSTQADLSDAVRAILKALAELSAAQGALDLDPERDHAPRDYAMQKAIAAFRQFEAGAKHQGTAHNLDPPHAQRQRISRHKSIG
jgi:hypothetical protein